MTKAGETFSEIDDSLLSQKDNCNAKLSGK